MVVENKEFIAFVEKEVAENVKYFAHELSNDRVSEITKEIVILIDWNNSTLMHKGLSWITQNYLKHNGII